MAQAPIDELKNRYGKEKIVVVVTDGADALAAALTQREWVRSVTLGPNGVIEVTVSDVKAAQHGIPAMVTTQGTGLSRLEVRETALEDVFIELVGGDRP